MKVKLHKNDKGQMIIAICDSELLGQKFEEGEKQLDLTTGFYDGEEKDAQEMGDIIRNADGVNLVGEKSIALGIQEGVVEKDQVMKIAGVPYAMALHHE